MTVPTREPTELRAGTTWAWRREDLTDYPAGTWTLKYYLKALDGQSHAELTASASGTAHAVDVTATDTGKIRSGKYSWVAVVTSGATVTEVARGTLTVLARYDQAANLDDRSHARRTLDAIEAVIEKRASIDQQQYQINGRMLTRMPIEDLIRFRDVYRREVLAEENAARIAAGLPSKGKLMVRFR